MRVQCIQCAQTSFNFHWTGGSTNQIPWNFFPVHWSDSTWFHGVDTTFNYPVKEVLTYLRGDEESSEIFKGGEFFGAGENEDVSDSEKGHEDDEGFGGFPGLLRLWARCGAEFRNENLVKGKVNRSEWCLIKISYQISPKIQVNSMRMRKKVNKLFRLLIPHQLSPSPSNQGLPRNPNSNSYTFHEHQSSSKLCYENGTTF